MNGPETPDPLRLRPHGLEFDELKGLSEYLDRLLADADASLTYFRDPALGGYERAVDPATGPQKSSKASTATCLAYLRATGKLNESPWNEKREELRTYLIDDKWTSAGLKVNNPFTTAFLLDAIQALGGLEGLSTARTKLVERKVALLNRALVNQRGGLLIEKYPPTSFLTHKVVRVLDQAGWLRPEALAAVSAWTWGHLYEESMLIAAGSPDADYFELAYAVLTASLTSRLDRMTPRKRQLLQHAIEQFFTGQREDGTWPRSRPLFLYPDIGYAYCYDYELLVYVLSDRQLSRFVFPHLAALRRAAWALDSRRVPLELKGVEKPQAFGWSSEHHGGSPQAESWPTASVFHFCFELLKLVADAVRRNVFDYLDATYVEPRFDAPTTPPLEDILDSKIEYDGGEAPFKRVFVESFLEPLVQERDGVRDGRRFSDDTNISAILYGPPGTSKTRLARMIADALGWPLLALDPSHLTRRGLDNVHAEADAVFSRLTLCDQIVVLLDEIDELVREREASGELTSRFLTTAMLPKIAALHGRRRIVYLVATNHVEKFDAAISRPGRFDVIVPVMPPTAEAKLEFGEFGSLRDAEKLLKDAGVDLDFMGILGDLTFDETDDLAGRLSGETDVSKLGELLERAKRGATLNQRVLDPDQPPSGIGSSDGSDRAVETWKDRIKSQRQKIRGLSI